MEKSVVKGVLFLMLFSLVVYFGFALTSVGVISPTIAQNVSGTILLNATTDQAALNVTFYWQDSSGNLVLNATIYNSTENDTVFENATFDTTLLTDGIYNLTVNATNATDEVVTNTSIVSVVVDNSAPNVASINTPASGANLSTGTQIFNTTVTDTTLSVDAVRFNITNGSSSVS